MKKYNRLTVFLGCAGALVMMAFLACAFGHYLPMILHPKYTCLLAGLLFVFFGIQLLYHAFKGGNGEDDEEKEVDKEIKEFEIKLMKNPED